MIKIFGILFAWMKYYHITKSNLLYKKFDVNMIKYSWLFYLLKLLYPIWLILGIILTGKLLFSLLLVMTFIKYFIYPLIKGKSYRVYDLVESIICIIMYVVLLF
jgi:Zn-dependent protease with chaperone function